MKQPRKLTRAEKIAVSSSGREPAAYMVVKVEGDLLHLVHKKTGKREFVSM
jgi:hypothetical protein